MSELKVELTDEITLTDEGPTVCIGVACNKYQAPAFWVPLVGAASNVTHFTWSQNGLIEFEKLDELKRLIAPRGALTDSNRNRIVQYFLEETECDYLFQMDDDVRMPFPVGVSLHKLLAPGYPIVSGIYYRGSKPYGPIAFLYAQEGPRNGYISIIDWEPDSMLRVDAVGMGCTLIHREVFERIQKEFVIVETWRGELRLEHPDDLEENMAPSDRVLTLEQFYEMKDHPLFPFYALSYMRTEDMYFCENAKRLGYDIWLDTSLEAEHLQTKPITREDFIKARREGEIKKRRKPEVWRIN